MRAAALAAAVAIAVVTCVALALAPAAVRAADAGKGKRNEALVSPHFADYGVERIALGGATSVDGSADNEKLFRQAIEQSFSELKYRFQGYSYFIGVVRQANAEPVLSAVRKAAFAGAPQDSAALAALRFAAAVDAVLFANLTTMERTVIDADTRGQSSTDVGAEFVLLSLRDGAVLWRGNFAERGLGAYNDPNVADVGQRDPTGNAQRSQGDALSPPEFREVMEKLLKKVAKSLPPPAAAAAAPAPAATPAPPSASH
jgi:hypothetical protein